MQIQGENQPAASPFDIIYNARSSRATRSRKSSINVIDKDKPRGKLKKLRKMTMNPQSAHYSQLREIEQQDKQHKVVRSERGDMKEEIQQFNIEDFLQLDGPRKIQSEKQLQLENGIWCGIGNERELDFDFNLSRQGYSQPLDIQMRD